LNEWICDLRLAFCSVQKPMQFKQKNFVISFLFVKLKKKKQKHTQNETDSKIIILFFLFLFFNF